MIWCHIFTYQMDFKVVLSFLYISCVCLTDFVTAIKPKDYCHPNPCLNSGSCVQVVGGYDCHCDEQYTGAHCEGTKPKLFVPFFLSSEGAKLHQLLYTLILP